MLQSRIRRGQHEEIKTKMNKLVAGICAKCQKDKTNTIDLNVRRSAINEFICRANIKYLEIKALILKVTNNITI